MKPYDAMILASQVLKVAEVTPGYASLSIDDKMLVMQLAADAIKATVSAAYTIEAMKIALGRGKT